MNSRGSVGSSPLARRLSSKAWTTTVFSVAPSTTARTCLSPLPSTPIAATKTWSPTCRPSIWMTSRSSSERSEASQASIFFARQRHKAPGNGRLRGAVATRFRQVALGQTDRAVVLAGRHVQDHQVERPLEQQVAVAQHLPALQTHLLASMVANPWPLHFHAAAVVADLALRMAPAINPDGSHGDDVGPRTRSRAMSLSLLKFVGQASLVDDAMLPS